MGKSLAKLFTYGWFYINILFCINSIVKQKFQIGVEFYKRLRKTLRYLTYIYNEC